MKRSSRLTTLLISSCLGRCGPAHGQVPASNETSSGNNTGMGTGALNPSSSGTTRSLI
jgi:hypothetical protein